MPQPNAPHLTNYPAAQAVRSKPGLCPRLGCRSRAGRRPNYISVEIGTDYSSTNLGSPGALTGTARTFTIPAGTLQPNTTYDSTISFYRYVAHTNGRITPRQRLSLDGYGLSP